MTETLLPSPTKTNSLGGVLPYGTTQDPVRDPGRSSSVVEIHRGISTIPGRPGRSAEGFEPLFGWPGGNRIRAPLIASLLKSHGTYLEPFVGGGSVAFRKRRVGHEVLGDIRADLINCYTQVRDHVDWMIERGRELEGDLEKLQAAITSILPEEAQKVVFELWKQFQDGGYIPPVRIEALRERVRIVEGVRPEVAAFALDMEGELKKHDDRPGWKNEKIRWLLERLYEEVQEIKEALDKGLGPDTMEEFIEDENVARWVRSEAADVGNFAMMIHDLVGIRSKGGGGP